MALSSRLISAFFALLTTSLLVLATATPGYAQAETMLIFTKTTLISSPNPDGTVTFRSSVSSRSGSVPAGSVKIIDETTQNLVGVFDVAEGEIRLPQLPTGNHRLRAYYGGSDSYFPYVAQPSSSEPISYNVLTAPNVDLSILQNDGGGELVTFTATVTSRTANVTGSVAFKAGEQVLATQLLDRNGKASFVTTALDRGSHRVVAQYMGGDAFAAASSETQTVNIGSLDTAATAQSRTSVAASFTPASIQ